MKRLLKLRLLFTAIAITGFSLVAGGLILAYSNGELDGNGLPNTDAILAAQIESSNDECVVCHTSHTPGIVNQYGLSSHFQNNVSCSDCHLVEENYPGGVLHPEAEFWVLGRSSPKMCESCHVQQVQEFNFSRHALPAYVAYAGNTTLTEEQMVQYQAIPEGGGYDARDRNSLHALEGPEITRFACESCHNIGAPNPDGSIGDCTDCHLRHEFSLEQVRKPETCNACHIGPDHPQWEIYQESAHGIAYMTGGHEWNWDAEPGTLTTVDMPAPTCATCHFSGFGLAATTHDVGDRLTWFLAAPISQPRPNAGENRIRMQNVCRTCHSDSFISEFYTDADAAVEAVNDFVRFSDYLVQPLKDNGLMTAAPFDEPIDFTYFNLWHHWGRTAKFGAWMQGADYTQWHGAYEILHDMAELREQVNEKLEAAGLEPVEVPEGFPGNEALRTFLEAQG